MFAVSLCSVYLNMVRFGTVVDRDLYLGYVPVDLIVAGVGKVSCKG
jgi:hypothetical protein